MPTDTLSPQPRHVSRRGLWFGFSAAAAAWAAYGAAWELISAESCRTSVGGLGPLSAEGVRWLLVGINLGCLVIALSAAATSVQHWRRVSGHHDPLHSEAPAVEQYLAVGGIFISLIFTIGIIWAGLPLIMVDICVKAR